MARLAENGLKPSVVDDQIGRLSFAEDIAAGIRHLIDSRAPYGVYNVTNDGDGRSWADIACEVFDAKGRNAEDVARTTTADYFADKPESAPRPLSSMLDLRRIRETGYVPSRWEQRLNSYVRGMLS
jgi:dTDP-4-dehydrorhamnose 3,5-epimerase